MVLSPNSRVPLRLERRAHSDVELGKILRYTKAEQSKVCDAELTFRIRPYPSPQFLSYFEWGKRLNLPVPEFAK